MPKQKWTRLPARDGKTPSNYARNQKGETWYRPLPQKPAPKPVTKPKAGS